MDEWKKKVAEAALEHVDENRILGIGSGSTVNYFIDALAKIKHRIDAVVAGSKASEARLRALGIPVAELNTVGDLPLYVDGADEVNARYEMIKGGGGALVREKILAYAAAEFLVLVDDSKVVERLGAFPIAVEVIPMARSFVARAMVKKGGDPVYRTGFTSDNGNVILDVLGLEILGPMQLETSLNEIPGVVDNGLFACRMADKVLVGSAMGVTLLPHL
jgi:ribose 5-phosphate isomerase A